MSELNIFHGSDYARIRARLVIDRYALDEENMELPMLQMEAAEIAEEASNRAIVAETTYKQMLAAAAETIQEEAAQAKRKVTVAEVANQAAGDALVKKAHATAITRRTSFNYWRALLDALQSKRSSLKRIGELHAAGYMTSPSAPEGRTRTTGGKPRLKE